MSINRLRYDDCAYVHRLAETIGPGDYMTQTPRICNECSHYAPGVMLQRKAGVAGEMDEVGNLVDIDSDLLLLTRKASECPTQKYLGPQSDPVLKTVKNTHASKECVHPWDLTPEPTLLSNPRCTNKETTINRWEWLCKDPQSTALIPFDYAINNRIVVKDAHRPCIERPLDQTASLPPVQNNQVAYDWSAPWRNKETCWPDVPVQTCCSSLQEMNYGH